MEAAWADIHTAKLPRTLVFRAAVARNFYLNRTYSSDGTCPFLKCLGIRPRSKHEFVPFGCRGLAGIPRQLRAKDGQRAESVLNMGPDVDTLDSFMVLRLSNRRLLSRRNVQWFPDDFPGLADKDKSVMFFLGRWKKIMLRNLPLLLPLNLSLCDDPDLLLTFDPLGMTCARLSRNQMM